MEYFGARFLAVPSLMIFKDLLTPSPRQSQLLVVLVTTSPLCSVASYPLSGKVSLKVLKKLWNIFQRPSALNQNLKPLPVPVYPALSHGLMIAVLALKV